MATKNAEPIEAIRRGTPEYERLIEEERLILEAAELVYRLLEESGTSRADLARSLGRTRGYVTQILSGRHNMTLRTLADVLFSLGHRVDLSARLLAKAAEGGPRMVTPSMLGLRPSRRSAGSRWSREMPRQLSKLSESSARPKSAPETTAA